MPHDAAAGRAVVPAVSSCQHREVLVSITTIDRESMSVSRSDGGISVPCSFRFSHWFFLCFLPCVELMYVVGVVL